MLAADGAAQTVTFWLRTENWKLKATGAIQAAVTLAHVPCVVRRSTRSSAAEDTLLQEIPVELFPFVVTVQLKPCYLFKFLSSSHLFRRCIIRHDTGDCEIVIWSGHCMVCEIVYNIWVCLKIPCPTGDAWLGGMIRGMIRGYDSWVWFADLDLVFPCILHVWLFTHTYPENVSTVGNTIRGDTWSALELACCWRCACCCQSGVCALELACWCHCRMPLQGAVVRFFSEAAGGVV